MRLDQHARAAIGRAARNKGQRAERDFAAYLRANGWPMAERAVVTGWRAADRESADPGDIRGTGPLVWQVKSVPDMSTLDVRRALDDVDSQTVAAGGDYGFVVQKRNGKADPGMWWAHTRLRELSALAFGHDAAVRGGDVLDVVTRVTVGDLVALLRHAGYGDPAS